MNRRDFVKQSGMYLGAAAAAGCATGTVGSTGGSGPGNPLFRISLAQWSINESFKTRGGTLDNLEFAKVARQNGYEAVEYVNQFFKDKAQDQAYLAEMNRIAAGEGVKNVLIMIDGEGRMGDPNPTVRNQAVENHRKWIDAAKTLGCHAVRVNAHGGPGTWEQQLADTSDGYGKVVAYGAQQGINVIIENHGGLSSDPVFLLQMMEKVKHPRAGVLPDFGNFRKGEGEPAEYVDAYDAVRMLMPYAKGLSVKGNATGVDKVSRPVDFERMLRIALDAGWRGGYAGVEYGGLQGIRGIREQLEAVRAKLTPLYS